MYVGEYVGIYIERETGEKWEDCAHAYNGVTSVLGLELSFTHLLYKSQWISTPFIFT